MAAKSPDLIRNIAFCGHGSCGKTTLVESLLLAGGAIQRKGSVNEGSTVCDFDEQEKSRKHSIDLACASVETKGTLIQFIDTPGYRDFVGQVYCASVAVDCFAVVVSGEEGVRPNTRKVWEIAADANLPCFVVINRLDREHADFERVLAQVQEQLSAKCLPMTRPDASGTRLSKVEAALGSSGPLVESIVESNDALMERYLEGEEIPEEEIANQCREAIATRGLFPVFATSAEKEIGVPELLDAIVRFAPPASRDLGRVAKDPADEAASHAVSTSAEQPFSARVFRVASDPFVGKLTCLRVFSGSLPQSGSFLNPHTGKLEKAGKVVRLQGKEQVAVDALHAGDIGALIKVEGLRAFDFLTTDRKLVMDAPKVPLPMASLATSPKTKADEKKFVECLNKLVDEDVCLKSQRDKRTGELVVSGISTLHLQILWERLKSRYGVEVTTRQPKTPYLETISAKGDAQYRHKKQTGGAGEFAEVWLRVEPLARGGGFEFENAVFGGAISNSFVESARKGVQSVMEQGVVAGCPVVDIKVEVYDGKEHPVDSKDVAFQKAGREAFKQAFLQAKPILLEPIVNLEVTFPSQFTGDIQGDLTRRRGRVQGVETIGDFQLLRAQVPLAEMAEYASSLGSVTGGQGSYTMEMAHYEPVPGNVQQKVIEAYRAEHENKG
jgi:elongation factor G